ncbi:MAG: hypothetical protein EBT28_07575, partial [Betaproteobacteria bacterium]|nr:hypothetical protein [Betaproteobacteria bacterium]
MINTATNTVTSTITVGSNPSLVAASTDGSNVYVVNILSNSVSVIGTGTNLVTSTIPVGNFPLDVVIS